MYRKLSTGVYYNTETGEYIPGDSTNRHYVEMQAAIAADSSVLESEGYIFYNYGAAHKAGFSSDVTTGQKFFSTEEPTTAQLKEAFPATAGGLSFEFSAAISGTEVVAINGTSFTVTSITDLITNINATTAISDGFTATSYTATSGFYGVKLLENCPGNIAAGTQVQPTAVAGSGTTLVNITTISSVYGYETYYKAQKKLDLEADADAIIKEYREAWFAASIKGKTEVCSAITTAISEAETSLYEGKKAIDNE